MPLVYTRFVTNPGNIGSDDRVKAVVQAARAKNIPIRIGVNSGSVEKRILEKYGAPTPEALVESALYNRRFWRRSIFYDICLSMKSFLCPLHHAGLPAGTRKDYRMPLHLGTRGRNNLYGHDKSAAGIGGLLALGIGCRSCFS